MFMLFHKLFHNEFVGGMDFLLFECKGATKSVTTNNATLMFARREESFTSKLANAQA